MDGLNMYRYVRNNPVNGVDALGYNTEDPPAITFPENAKKGDLYTPGEGSGTNWTYVYDEKDGWMPLSNGPEVTVTPEEESIQEITTGSFWGDLLLGEVPIVGAAVDIYNTYAALENGDYFGAALNALSIIPLAGVAAKVGKKAWKAVSPYVDDFIEGHKQIGRDIASVWEDAKSAWKNTKDWFRRGGGGTTSSSITRSRSQCTNRRTVYPNTSSKCRTTYPNATAKGRATKTATT